ncbi:unnamed protein product, partial [Ectocarpus sp. 12 AP-2014]
MSSRGGARMLNGGAPQIHGYPEKQPTASYPPWDIPYSQCMRASLIGSFQVRCGPTQRCCAALRWRFGTQQTLQYTPNSGANKSTSRGQSRLTRPNSPLPRQSSHTAIQSKRREKNY